MWMWKSKVAEFFTKRKSDEKRVWNWKCRVWTVFKDSSSHNNFWHFAEESEENQVKISELELNWVFRKFVIHCKLKKRKYNIFFLISKSEKKAKRKENLLTVRTNVSFVSFHCQHGILFHVKYHHNVISLMGPAYMIVQRLKRRRRRRRVSERVRFLWAYICFPAMQPVSQTKQPTSQPTILLDNRLRMLSKEIRCK